MSQPRHHSLWEVCVGTAVGFAVNVAVQRLVFPWFGIEIQMASNLGIAAIFTVISVARGYAVRRWFNGRVRAAEVGDLDFAGGPIPSGLHQGSIVVAPTRANAVRLSEQRLRPSPLQKEFEEWLIEQSRFGGNPKNQHES